MKRLTLAALGLVALAVPASAATWSDTYLGYRTGNNFREPGYQQSIQKQIWSLSGVYGNDLGSNFFNVDMLKSDSGDPVNTKTEVSFPGVPNKQSDKGAQEVYVTYRNNLSLSKIFKTNMAKGVIRDVEWTTGGDYNAKNTTFAPSVYKLMTGPTLSFNVPGFLTVGLQFYKEWNHNAFGYLTANGGTSNVVFKGTWQLNAAWGIPVALGKVDTKVKGFLAMTGPKGQDGSNVKTTTETLADIFWMADFSSLLGAKKGTWQIGPGFEYWNAKFGDPAFRYNRSTPAGFTVNPTTTTTMVALEYHF